jgi:hypothetical protein
MAAARAVMRMGHSWGAWRRVKGAAPRSAVFGQNLAREIERSADQDAGVGAVRGDGGDGLPTSSASVASIPAARRRLGRFGGGQGGLLAGDGDRPEMRAARRTVS